MISLGTHESQDVLCTLTDQQAETSALEPWIREFKCSKVTFDPIAKPSIRFSESSLESVALPSLRDEYADFAQLGSRAFPVSLVNASSGIEFLFGRLFKVYRRVVSSPKFSDLQEFMQVVGLIEFVGTKVGLLDNLAVTYRTLFSKFLSRIGPFSTAVSSLPKSACSQNVPLHVSLFSWSAACKVFSGKPYEVNQENKSLLSVDEVIMVLLDGLSVLWKNCDSTIPCSCVQSTLVELYRTQCTRFLGKSFHMINCLISGEQPYSANHLCNRSMKTTPGDFFAFFCDIISHLIDVQVISSDEIMPRFILMAGMADLFDDATLLLTCKILFEFVQKYELKGLAKIRKYAAKFVTRILQYIDAVELPEFEQLSRGNGVRWAECVKNSFRCCSAEETVMIRFLASLLSDEQLSTCRGIVNNRYSSVKLLISDCVLSSMLSMLLALVNQVQDGYELASKICDWIVGAIPRANDTQCTVFFNALDALYVIVKKEKLNGTAMAGADVKCMNSLQLPRRNQIFRSRYLLMLRSHQKVPPSLDIDRFVAALSTEEFLEFVYLLVEVATEISGTIWDRAVTLLKSVPKDAKLRDFIVNQVAIGIEDRSLQSMTRFKMIVEKMQCVQPDADFLFAFCTGILSRLPNQSSHYVRQLVPLWIYAVLTFSATREMDTKKFTSMIWDHLLRTLTSSESCATSELPSGNCELVVTTFFKLLGSATISVDIVRKIVADAIPPHLAHQIVALLKSDEREVQERTLRVCGQILSNVGFALLTIADLEAQHTGLNRTAFVLLTQASVAKIVKSSLDAQLLLQIVPCYVSALATLPYRVFIYSRLKDLLLKFAYDSAMAPRICSELAVVRESAIYKQLAKESDQRIKVYLCG